MPGIPSARQRLRMLWLEMQAGTSRGEAAGQVWGCQTRAAGKKEPQKGFKQGGMWSNLHFQGLFWQFCVDRVPAWVKGRPDGR